MLGDEAFDCRPSVVIVPEECFLDLCQDGVGDVIGGAFELACGMAQTCRAYGQGGTGEAMGRSRRDIVPRLTGLIATSLIPASKQRARWAAVVSAVRPMMGIADRAGSGEARTARARAEPFISGMWQSVISSR